MHERCRRHKTNRRSFLRLRVHQERRFAPANDRPDRGSPARHRRGAQVQPGRSWACRRVGRGSQGISNGRPRDSALSALWQPPVERAMTFSSKAHTIEMALAELAALPYANAQPGEGFFRGSSFADGHPMVMTWVNDPLDGWQRVWYHVEIQPPRAFNSCSVCDRDFPGPRGAT